MSSPRIFNSAAWLCFLIKPGTPVEQERLLCATLKNLFNSAPKEIKQPWYTHVVADTFTVLPDTSGNKDLKSVMSTLLGVMKGNATADLIGGANSPTKPITAVDRVVLVALLHETDYFEEVERQMIESDLFMSRALHTAQLELQTTKTFKEILERSRMFHHYESKLFGPQEGELGDEGMNPLRFAKEVRQKKKIATEMAETAGKMTREFLTEQCRSLGLRDTGLAHDLAARLVPVYRQQAELAGRGELSNFATELIQAIYKVFRHTEKDEEIESKAAATHRRTAAAAAGLSAATSSYEAKGMKLWEMNELLATTKTGTIYDQKEYKHLLEEQQLLVDRDGNLAAKGFEAYYRANGRLSVDNDGVGIGSLNDMLAGKLIFNATFEPDSLVSLFFFTFFLY
jgi:hypothetical protein